LVQCLDYPRTGGRFRNANPLLFSVKIFPGISIKYLSTIALQPDGKIGYVQLIGEKAIPKLVVDAASTTNFGVGAFLLAGCEMHRFVTKK
jgi:hypothetical protein